MVADDRTGIAIHLNGMFDGSDVAAVRERLESLAGRPLPTFSLEFKSTPVSVAVEINDGTGRRTTFDLVDVVHRGLISILEQLAGEIALERPLEEDLLRELPGQEGDDQRSR